jgi:hypothetical protein
MMIAAEGDEMTLARVVKPPQSVWHAVSVPDSTVGRYALYHPRYEPSGCRACHCLQGAYLGHPHFGLATI